MKRILFLLFVAAVILVPAATTEARTEKPLPFWIGNPHVWQKNHTTVQIQFRSDIPMLIDIWKINSKTGKRTEIFVGMVKLGNIRIYDKKYVKGDQYHTYFSYCLPLNELPSCRHPYYSPYFGPFNPVEWYWRGWPKR